MHMLCHCLLYLSLLQKRLNGVKKDLFGVEQPLPPFDAAGATGRKAGGRYSSYSAGGRLRRSTFEEDQLDFFECIGDLISNTFAIDGKACLQRLICELTEVPVHEQSFMGEILHRIVE